MMRRIPLWATLIPLVVAVLAYRFWWTGERDAFQTQLERLFPSSAITMGGFPYRLEADVVKPTARRDGELFTELSAERLVINRLPWRPELTVAHTVQPRMQRSVPSLNGVRLDIESASSQSSLRTDGRHILRLSSAHDDARVWLAMLPAPVSAARFEQHVRETLATADPASRSPTPPEQAQVVLSGEELRFGGGDPLTFAASIGVTSTAPAPNIAAWRNGGTIELRRLTLADKTGEVLAMSATATPAANGQVQVAGTLETVCPFTLRAAFRGRPAPAEERRTRKPVKLACRGEPGDFELVEAEGGLRQLPVRGQEPPCPVFRR